MSALKQIVGFLVLIGFLWGVSLLGNAFLALGLPGILAWPAAVVAVFLVPVVALVGWQRMAAWRLESKPGVKGKQASDGPAVGETLRQIAIACRHQGKYDDAGRLYQEEEALLRKERGLESERAAAMYNDWGYLMVAAGRPAQGSPLYEKAIAVRDREGDPMALATTLDNLADAQVANGDPMTAAQTSDRWFALISRVVTQRSGVNDHPLLAPALEQHAGRVAGAGRGEEAETLRARAQAIRAQHPDEAAQYEPAHE